MTMRHSLIAIVLMIGAAPASHAESDATAPASGDADTGLEFLFDDILGADTDAAPVAAQPESAAGDAGDAAPPPPDPAPAPAPTAAAAAAETLPTIPVAQLSEKAPTAPPAKKAPATVGLEEIVVTAERRASTVQDTPISIEAFNEEKLELRGIEGLADLSANVPSMVVEPFPTHNATLRITIRGVGVTDAQVTQDPAVGIYLDGVYIARSVGLALDMADLERIEVLRGPQGILYGRNTTGGAVNLVTRRPSTEAFSLSQSLNVDSYNLLSSKTSVNVPVNDEFAVKLALLQRRRDGYVENTSAGGDFGDRRETSLRFDARWFASDWLTADYAYDWTDLQYYNYQFQAVIPSYTSHGQADLFKPYAQEQSVYSSQPMASQASGPPMEASGSRIQGHTLTLSAPLGNSELKYIGAFRELEDDEYADLGGGAGSLGYRVDTHVYSGPAATAAYGGPTPLVVPQVFQSQWSHEIQFSGSLFDDSLSFITGLFYFDETGGENGHPIHHVFSAQLDPVQTSNLFSALPELYDLVRDLALPRIVAFWDYDYRIHNRAYAAFGQLTWNPDFLDRRLRITAGLRQSRDEREATKNYVQSQYLEGQAAGIGLLGIEIPAALLQGNDVFDNVHASSTYDNLSPSANIQFDLTDDATTYLSYASAYKSGGFNVRDPQVSGASGPASDGVEYGFGFVEGFKPERVRSLEAGLKSEWMGRRLRFNASLFESRYRDMQTNFLIAGTISDTKSRNAGKARMRGIELESAFVALPDLILALQYAYLDAEVQEVIDINGDNVAHLYPFIAAPPHSFVASVDWTFLRADWGTLRAYTTYQYVGDRTGFVITEEKRGLTAIDGYGILNARIGASDIHLGHDGTLDVALWSKNVLDEAYPLTAVDNLPHADRAVIWGEPRSFGFDLTYRYY